MARSKTGTRSGKKDSPSRSNEAAAPRSDDAKSSGDDTKPKLDGRSQDGLRETMESIVVAFLLAFLFRSFAAEAFVIPTGSMAPTLYGRNKDVTCAMCGFHYVFGASDEVDDDSGRLTGRILGAHCPNCRYSNDVKDLPVFTGDRILVNKFPYEFSEPGRWDVPVFKYPETPTTNYIKRLVGLPGETIRIRGGDLYSVVDRKPSILRKPPEKQRVLQIPVYDHNHPESLLHERGWPRRWVAVDRRSRIGTVAGWGEAFGTWQENDAEHSFHIDTNAASDLAWLRYRHIIPRSDDWAEALGERVARRSDEARPPRPEIIADYCGYNAYQELRGSGNDDDLYWVGDLTLSCRIEIDSVADNAEIVLELVEGLRQFRCRIDPSTGIVRLTSVVSFTDSEEDVLLEARTSVTGPGHYDLRFSNVDDRLDLWVNGTLAEGEGSGEHIADPSLPQGPRDGDLIPVGIAVRGIAATVSNLLIERDIYYRADQPGDFGGYESEASDFTQSDLRRRRFEPERWSELYYNGDDRTAEFVLGEDEFLMLGDNSPKSQDSRLWSNMRGAEHRHAVPRSALVGRAFYVYWPHGIPFLGSDGNGWAVRNHVSTDYNGKPKTTDYPTFRLPFYPDISRMNRIR